jgi:hypothetical protein
MPEEMGTLRLLAERAGTVAEASQFLADLEGAYLALYSFEARLYRWQRNRRVPFDIIWESVFYPLKAEALTSDTLLPEHRLVISRIRIESPGFWEVVASFNPLQQLREYLKDRHERGKDKRFREAAEREKAELENQLIQRQIWEKENTILRDRIGILKELGYTDQDIQQLVWEQLGPPLLKLGKHQDSSLIGGVG